MGLLLSIGKETPVLLNTWRRRQEKSTEHLSLLLRGGGCALSSFASRGMPSAHQKTGSRWPLKKGRKEKRKKEDLSLSELRKGGEKKRTHSGRLGPFNRKGEASMLFLFKGSTSTATSQAGKKKKKEKRR